MTDEKYFMVGQEVQEVTGDYRYRGVVVARFAKRNQEHIRYVVENDDGMLFIFNASQLSETNGDLDGC